MPPKEQDKKPVTAAPARLDSLNRRGSGPTTGSSSAPRGKFKPKAVARRTKEERDKTAPQVEKPIVEEKPKLESNKPGRGGRGAGDRGGRGGGNRGGRGGGNSSMGRGGRFQQPSVAAMGPFAAPNMVKNDTRRSATPIFSSAAREGTPSYSPGQLRLKSETPGGDSDSPGPDDNRIDMTSNMPVSGDLAAYFPIRLERRDDEEEEELPPVVQEQKQKEQQEDTTIKIKKEPGEDGGDNGGDEMMDIKNVEPQAPHGPLRPVKYLSAHERKELERIKQDHELITDEFNIKASLDESKAKALEQKLYFFQFPAVMPQFERQQEPEQQQEQEQEQEPENKPLEGLAGHLRLHESGKLTMVMGDIVMEVSQGTECNFLQDVVVLDKEENKACLIGQVSRKMVVSPDVDRLLAGDSHS